MQPSTTIAFDPLVSTVATEDEDEALASSAKRLLSSLWFAPHVEVLQRAGATSHTPCGGIDEPVGRGDAQLVLITGGAVTTAAAKEILRPRSRIQK